MKDEILRQDAEYTALRISEILGVDIGQVMPELLRLSYSSAAHGGDAAAEWIYEKLRQEPLQGQMWAKRYITDGPNWFKVEEGTVKGDPKWN